MKRSASAGHPTRAVLEPLEPRLLLDAGVLDHFEWSAIASPQRVNGPFGAALTAVDDAGAPVSDYSGTVALAGRQPGEAVELTGVILNAGFEAFTPEHWSTTQRAYSGTQWASEGNRSLRIYTGAQETREAGSWLGAWQEVDLTGVAGLRFDVTTTESAGGTWADCEAAVCVDQTRLWGGAGVDQTWLDVEVDTSAFTGVHTLSVRLSFLATGMFAEDVHFDNLRTYTAALTEVAVAPVTLELAGGVWAGDVTVAEAAADMFLIADDGEGHRGQSGAFDALAVPLTVDLPASAAEGDGVLVEAGTVSIPEPLTADLAVTLASDDTSELRLLSETVTIRAGDISAPFDVQIVDDPDWDMWRTASVTASAAGYVGGSDSVGVADDEVPGLTLTVPASACESDGVLTGAGTLGSTLAPTVDVWIELGSDNTSEVGHPGMVLLPAGEASAAFDVPIVDDTEIDGDAGATVAVVDIPGAAGWTGGTDSILVTDDDRWLTVSVPPDVWESDGLLVGAGTVTIGGTFSAPLAVTVSSDDGTEILTQPPPVVTIPAGQTSAAFDLDVRDDADGDGEQAVTMAAAADGFDEATAGVRVHDDEVHHLAISPIADQTAGVGFGVTVEAINVDGEAIEVFDGLVGLSATSAGRPVPVAPTQTGAFSAGRWTGQVAVEAVADGVVLAAELPPGGAVLATSNPFDVTWGPMDRFEWDPIGRQWPDWPFAATLRATDANGYLVGDFDGCASLAGLPDPMPGSAVAITEIDVGNTDSIEIQNVSADVVMPTGWVVAVGHSYTDINVVNDVHWALSDPIGPGEVLYRTDSRTDNYFGGNLRWQSGSNGWAMILDDRGSVVDFAAWGWSAAEIAALNTVVAGHFVTIGEAFSGSGAASSGTGTIQRIGNCDSDTAADFVWASPRSKGFQNAGLTVPFAIADAYVPIAPQQAWFVGGVAPVDVTVLEAAEQMLLRAVDGEGHTGRSNPFAVALNTPPTAVADFYVVEPGATLIVPPHAGVLANDIDADGGPAALTCTQSAPPPAGSLTLRADGSFQYAAPADFYGPVTFDYQARDGRDGSAAATVTVMIAIPGDANLDETVDYADYVIARSHTGGLSGMTWAFGDCNGDGRTDHRDYLLLKCNFGRSVHPAAAPAAEAPLPAGTAAPADPLLAAAAANASAAAPDDEAGAPVAAGAAPDAYVLEGTEVCPADVLRPCRQTAPADAPGPASPSAEETPQEERFLPDLQAALSADPLPAGLLPPLATAARYRYGAAPARPGGPFQSWPGVSRVASLA